MRGPLPLDCDAVTRALAAPAGEVDGPTLAGHLASCPDCAAWAERDAALTALWESTRPSEPSEAEWDAVWSRVTAELDRPERRAVPLRSWRRHGSTVFVVAQAAAIFAAVVLWAAHRPPAGLPGPAASTAPASTPAPLVQAETPAVSVDIEPGEAVLIRFEGHDLRTIKLTHDERSNTLDEMFVWFNDVEAMAGMIHDAHAATPPG